ncbi:formate dehydrogenase accessory sulfurtransferase FdhD [Pyrococcus yayanosii]|uniref:Protein FdhD n=1 Tax=Pyrococcus yayanosii (strain CH1 / JCM 16557) TaxID=529709 RepID=F8AJ49_PYRYC|nr:formate dehydrogenase accessory sulfurtransferase FdhD [Pyrococcus yayanosii]AEH24780.1 formate dehydrogenase family accessory protein FdhD [Pyrococcus yayanosii CH1]
MIKKVKVIKWQGDLTETEDYVCVEETFEIFAVYEGQKEFIAELPASPSQLKELGAGFLVCEGLAEQEDIMDVWVDGNRIYVEIGRPPIYGRLMKIHSPCGDPYRARTGKTKGTNGGDLKVSPDLILRISSAMTTLPETWKKTGGTHWAALFELNANIVAFSEDIGRHNAIDKVVGHAVLNGMDLGKLILASSGRMPYGMVKKVVNAGIPIVVTKSPPTDKGVELAKRYGVTLIGFARGGRFNVYAGEERLAF